MGWKNWPSWLKGGVISVIILGAIAIVSFIIPNFYNFFYLPEPHGDYFTEPPGIIFIIFSIVYFLVRGFFEPVVYSLIPDNKIVFIIVSITIIFLTVVYYFAIGAFIGWLYGKIKSRRESKIK